MLSAANKLPMLNVIILNVIMLSVVILNVMAPIIKGKQYAKIILSQIRHNSIVLSKPGVTFKKYFTINDINIIQGILTQVQHFGG